MEFNFLLSSYKFILSTVDILLVYVITYYFFSWLKNTNAFDLFKGLFLIFVVFLLSSILNLTTLNWILQKFTTVLLIVVVIIFQPELRRFLERVGSRRQLFTDFTTSSNINYAIFINQLLKAVEHLSQKQIGGIIVFEGQTSLEQFVETGITVNADISSEVLISLFFPASPTHDGAVIIKRDKIQAASCFLPLTEFPIVDRRLGTRHRAGIGISEVSDALVVVVSEETGTISLVEKGEMTRYLTKEALETRLFSFYSTFQKQKSQSIDWSSYFKIFKQKQ